MELVEKLVKSIPWGHNQRIMYKCKNIEEALFYAQKTMDNGWSRTVLEHQIDSGLYDRQGKAIINFPADFAKCIVLCFDAMKIKKKN